MLGKRLGRSFSMVGRGPTSVKLGPCLRVWRSCESPGRTLDAALVDHRPSPALRHRPLQRSKDLVLCPTAASTAWIGSRRAPRTAHDADHRPRRAGRLSVVGRAIRYDVRPRPRTRRITPQLAPGRGGALGAGSDRRARSPRVRPVTRGRAWDEGDGSSAVARPIHRGGGERSRRRRGELDGRADRLGRSGGRARSRHRPSAQRIRVPMDPRGSPPPRGPRRVLPVRPRRRR